MPRTPRERETLLRLLGGPQPVLARELLRLRRLERRGLLKLLPPAGERPKHARLTELGGTRLAAERQADDGWKPWPPSA